MAQNTATAQSTAATVMSGLNVAANSVSDFFKTYIKEIDSNIPFSGVSSPSASNGTEKAAVGAGFLAGFATGEGESVSVYMKAESAYVGITKDLAAREAQHGEQLVEVVGGLTRQGARGVEQAIIEQKGLQNLTNKINSIAKTNTIYQDAVQFGRQLLRSIGFNP